MGHAKTSVPAIHLIGLAFAVKLIWWAALPGKLTSLVPRDQTGRARTRPQERSILCSRAQCMQISSIDMGLDYDSTVMLTCKLLFAAAKSIGLDMPRH